jgi:ABC-type antimicrobial peptide transport system permease subunit
VTSVLRDGLKTTLFGGALGLGTAVLATPLIATELYGVHPLDLATFIVVTAVMLAASIAACWIPARRASRVDPMVALRDE